MHHLPTIHLTGLFDICVLFHVDLEDASDYRRADTVVLARSTRRRRNSYHRNPRSPMPTLSSPSLDSASENKPFRGSLPRHRCSVFDVGPNKLNTDTFGQLAFLARIGSPSPAPVRESKHSPEEMEWPLGCFFLQPFCHTVRSRIVSNP